MAESQKDDRQGMIGNMFKKKQSETTAHFTPQPMKLPADVVAARQKTRDAKLNQTLEEAVAEIRAERETRQREAWQNFGRQSTLKPRRNWHS